MIINFVEGVEAEFIQMLGTVISQVLDEEGVFTLFWVYEYNGEVWYLS